MSPLRVGFIGLGAIGLPMARRLAESPEIDLAIFDVRADVLEREAALGRVATSLADVVVDRQVIVSVLPADPQVRAVADELQAAVTAGQIYVDFSTIAPRTIRHAEQLLSARGVRVVGGGLTKSVAAAETGELSIFVGGEAAEDRALLDRVYAPMATDVRRVAEAGGAKALKVFNNMIVSGLTVMGCEALAIAARNGIDPRTAAEHLRDHGAESWPLVNQVIKHVLADELAPGRFSTRYMAKDASLAITVARDHARPAWFASVAKVGFRGTTALGLGDHYNPSVIRWFERSSNSPQIRTSGARESVDAGGRDRLNAIGAAARAHQALLCLDALTLLALEGLRPADAVPHLQSASSANAFLAELSSDRDGYPTQAIARLADDLQAGIELAEDGRGIALAWETSSNYATALVDRLGPEVTLGAVVDGLDELRERSSLDRTAA